MWTLTISKSVTIPTVTHHGGRSIAERSRRYLRELFEEKFIVSGNVVVKKFRVMLAGRGISTGATAGREDSRAADS